MDFQYYSPTRLIVGRGKIAEAGGLLEGAGKKVFVVAGRSAETSGILERLCKVLQSHQKDPVPYIKPPGEPTVSMTDQAAEVALQAGCSAVVSLGGGSVIDLAKAVAGLVTNGVGIEDYLEGVGSGRPVTKPALPHIAIPTTAGTGAEMTRNAVIRSTEGRFKKKFPQPLSLSIRRDSRRRIDSFPSPPANCLQRDGRHNPIDRILPLPQKRPSYGCACAVWD